MDRGPCGIGGWIGTAEAGVNLVTEIKADMLANPNAQIISETSPGLMKATIMAASGSVLSINAGPSITIPSSGVLDIPFGTVFIRSIIFAAETADVNVIYVY